MRHSEARPSGTRPSETRPSETRPSETRKEGRQPARLAIAGLLSATLLLTQPAWGADYGASAEAPGDPTTRASVTAERNKVDAATAALNACDRRRDPQDAACEVTELAGDPLRTASELRAAVPSSDHPLFLWRYQSRTATVYLAGSIHLLKPALYPLHERFEEAFAAADTLVLEIDTRQLDPQVMQRKTLDRAVLAPGQTLNSLLSADEQALLRQRATEFGFSIEQLQRFEPMLVSQMLAVTALGAAGYPEQSGVEEYFLSRIGDRRVLQLETIDQQLNLMFDLPLATQAELLVASLTQYADSYRWMEDLIIAWLSGDTGRFEALLREELGDSEAAQRFNEQLLDARNVPMAAQISEYLKTAGTYLVLVGAGHTVGPAGIVELLRQRGINGFQLRTE